MITYDLGKYMAQNPIKHITKECLRKNHPCCDFLQTIFTHLNPMSSQRMHHVLLRYMGYFIHSTSITKTCIGGRIN